MAAKVKAIMPRMDIKVFVPRRRSAVSLAEVRAAVAEAA